MKRWHEDYSRTYREWKKRYLHLVESKIDWNKEVGKDPYDCEVQLGRYRKTDAWDCGNPQCGICHSDKFPKRDRTQKEILSDLKFREGLNDLGLKD